MANRFDVSDPPGLESEIRDWEERELPAFLARQRERKATFLTGGGLPVKRVSIPTAWTRPSPSPPRRP
jgi:hypothetical protein